MFWEEKIHFIKVGLKSFGMITIYIYLLRCIRNNSVIWILLRGKTILLNSSLMKIVCVQQNILKMITSFVLDLILP